MKEVYLLRHGEKDATGKLTDRGKQAAEAMRPLLPHFSYVASSDSDRTRMTAKLLTGKDPIVDRRAAFATTSAEVSEAINGLAKKHAISFLDAAREYNDAAVLRGIDEQARELNAMIDELLTELAEGERALIVSHDLTIAPAMGLRDMPAVSINPLGGYIISVTNEVMSVSSYERAF